MPAGNLDDLGFKRWNFDNEKFQATLQNLGIVYNGKTKCGKSTLMLWHAYLMVTSKTHRFSTALIFCPNAKIRDEWAKRVPRSWLYVGWNERVLRQEMERRKRWQEEGRKIKPMLFVADDCSFDPKFLNKSLALAEAMKVGRNYGMTRMVACQWILDLVPGLREQFDIAVFPKTNQPVTIAKIHKNFGGPIASPATFYTIFRRLTQKWGAMVIFQNPQAEAADEEIFWTRAEPSAMEQDELKKGFAVIGRNAFWLLDRYYYRQKIQTDAYAVKAPRTGQVIRMIGADAPIIGSTHGSVREAPQTAPLPMRPPGRPPVSKHESTMII
jgi:hypothetical protein